jgi:hypothetical protein
VLNLADLGATEHLPAIREWFAAGLVDDSYVDLADIEADIQRRSRRQPRHPAPTPARA